MKFSGFLIAAVCGSLSAAAAGGPGKLQLNLLTKPGSQYVFSMSYIGNNGHVTENFNSYSVETKGPIVRKLAEGSQLLFINNNTFLVNGSETLEMEYDVSVAGKARLRVLKNDRKFQLPRRIDSAYKTCYDAETRADLDKKFNSVDTWVASEKKALQLSAGELETIRPYEGFCRMIARRNLLQNRPETAKSEGFSEWYFEGFDMADPNFDRIGNLQFLNSIVLTWWMGRQAADPGLEARFEMVDLMRTAKSTVLRDEAARSWMFRETRYKHWTPAIKEIYPVLKAGVSSPSAHTYIDSLYNRYVVLEKGRPAPNFAAKNEQFKTVRLSDFKGKMVVIDIWAHWCTYCIAKLPRYREIAEKYKGKEDIVFLTIAWHSPGFEKLWMELAEKARITGPNNLTVIVSDDDKMSKDLFEDGYRITQAPRYVVIDKNGNFLNNALNVSLDEKVEQEIEDYYNQQSQ